MGFFLISQTDRKKILVYAYFTPGMKTLYWIRLLFQVVIKSWGLGISPSYYECHPRLLLLVNRRKIEPKEIPIYLIPGLLVVFTRQLEI